jgi:hypothetical protein
MDFKAVARAWFARQIRQKSTWFGIVFVVISVIFPIIRDVLLPHFLAKNESLSPLTVQVIQYASMGLGALLGVFNEEAIKKISSDVGADPPTDDTAAQP